MSKKTLKIGVVAPSCRIERDLGDSISQLLAKLYPENPPELWIHPQCFLSDGHFAGSDYERAQAFLEAANDPEIDAVWFARGGYGACRILEAVDEGLTDAARAKTYMGYSDLGSLLALLYNRGFEHVAHGPVLADLNRKNGEAAIKRALSYLVEDSLDACEPSVHQPGKLAAFNIAVLAQLMGTPYQPRLDGYILMLEEVSEYMYRIDRFLFQLTSNPDMRKVAGLKLGRCSDIPANDPPFEKTEEEVITYWCSRSGIPYLGRADIGHDADNKIVPFGPTPASV